MWLDQNRITPSSFRLGLSIHCPQVLGKLPVFFDEGSIAHIRVAKPVGRPAWLEQPNRFRTRLLVESGGIEVTSSQVSTRTVRTPYISGASIHQLTFFEGFDGDDLLAFSNPETWRGAYVDVVVEGRGRDIADDVYAAMPDQEKVGKEDLATVYDISEIAKNDDFYATPLPCSVNGKLYVNQREVAMIWGRVAQVTEGDEDTKRLVILKVPVQPVEPDALPNYSRDLGFRLR
jgi:hypothetical protein